MVAQIPPQTNRKLDGMSREAVALARWFVETLLREPWNAFRHERQVFAAAALLDAGHTSSDVKGCALAFRDGTLACCEYKRRRPVSLFSLTTDTYGEWGQITSPLREYVHGQKVTCYRERPALHEALLLREGAYFAAQGAAS